MLNDKDKADIIASLQLDELIRKVAELYVGVPKLDPILESEPMLNDKDKSDIVAILKMFREDHCMTTDLESIDCRNRCDELIRKVAELYVGVPHSGGGQAMPDDRTAARLATNGWKVGTKLRNKRHGWEGEIVAPLGRKGLINVEVGVGTKVGEHSSDWDFVCGPVEEAEER